MEKCTEYFKQSENKDPHIYQIAVNAYKSLLSSLKSQAILVR